MTDDKLIEILAKEAHERWVLWAKTIMKSEKLISKTRRNRWARLIDTPYEKLTEMEKESDRIHARRLERLLIDYYDSKGLQLI
jgi:hypothetical protein